MARPREYMKCLRRGGGISGETAQLSSSSPRVPASSLSETAFLFTQTDTLCDDSSPALYQQVLTWHRACSSSQLIFLRSLLGSLPAAAHAHGCGYCAFPREGMYFFRQKIKVVNDFSTLEAQSSFLLARYHRESVISPSSVQ